MARLFQLLFAFTLYSRIPSEISEPSTSKGLGDIMPVVVPIHMHAKPDRHSLARLGQVMDKFGEAVLEQKDTYPTFHPKNDREMFLYAFLADIVDDENLPCNDPHDETLHESFKRHYIAVQRFTKMVRFIANEIDGASLLSPSLESNATRGFLRILQPLLQAVPSLEELSSELTRMAAYKASVDISRAKLPVSVRCRYLDARRVMVGNLQNKTEGLSGLVAVADEMLDFLKVVTQLLDANSNAPEFGQKIADLRQRWQMYNGKMASDRGKQLKGLTHWEKLAKKLPDYL